MDNRINILQYEGLFYLDSIEMLLYKVKMKLESMDLSIALKKKLFNIVVECIDNIQKHSEKQISIYSRNQIKHAYFTLDFENNYYIIQTQNVILNDEIVGLTERLNYLNSLDKDGLRKNYEKVITDGKISTKGGAGLGLFDIAIKSGNKMEYHFSPINEFISYFTLTTKVQNIEK